IQSAKAYEEMVDLIGTLEKIARAAKEHDEGQGIPVDEFFREFEKKHGLTRDAVQG
ncbi:MAG TPA: hypothetical protein GX399_19365, partial [Xanthomonadaceae bacterium]|nr:hypothetical protein [Xanthomonadaceae bacterium]